MRIMRSVLTFGTLTAALAVCLALAVPALAADGVRVTPTTSPLPAPYAGENYPSVSGDYLAYVANDPADSDDSVIVLKRLTDSSAGTIIGNRPAGFKDASPQILATGSDMIVIWTRHRLAEPWDSHVCVWKGTWDVTGGFQPVNDSFPKELVISSSNASQEQPAIGVVNVSGVSHTFVAWEDTRDNGPFAPLVYALDLTADTAYIESGYDATDVGFALDSTDILARGQRRPSVGKNGIYWLDDRWSFWDDGNLTGTAVWRYNPAAFTPASFFWNSDRKYDNGGDNSGPMPTTDGALWLRRGPYGSATTALPYVKPAGGTGFTLSPIVQPNSPSTCTKNGAKSTGVAIIGRHGNSASSGDSDVFYYDTKVRAQVKVCDRSAPTPSDPNAFKYEQWFPAIGAATIGYRIVWVDGRDATAEDSPDTTLYQAFVPTISWKLPTTVRNLTKVRPTVTVRPAFAGLSVKLQRVKPVRTKGGTVYQPYSRTDLASAKLVLGQKGTNSSVATLSWTPKTKGVYYLRVWFAGGTKYATDGITVATQGMVAVPHTGNHTNVVKVTVK